MTAPTRTPEPAGTAVDERPADEHPADERPTDAHTSAVALDAFATWLIRATATRDLSLTTAATLSTLARRGPLRLSDLAGREGVTQPSMTALVSRLERDGLATRGDDPDDGRAVNVSITDAGRDALAARRDRRAGVLATLLADLDDADRRAIAAAAPALARLAGTEPVS